MIIYKVKNLVNSKIYIGLTTETLEQRKGRHIRNAFNQNSNLVFHMALRKYGVGSFTWEVIDDTASNENELQEKEIYYISFFNSYIHADKSNGYNMTRGGDGTFGYSHTDESKQKMSSSHKGKILSDEHKRNMSIARTGRIFTEETKQKMSSSSKGKIHTDETKRKLSDIKKRDGSTKGSKNPKAKLNEEDVLKIKELLVYGMKQIKIAEMYGVSFSAINRIKLGKTWKHVMVS